MISRLQIDYSGVCYLTYLVFEAINNHWHPAVVIISQE